MKINEASVINNKVIDELMVECMHSGIYEVLEYIKSQSKPLETIIQDAYQQGMNDSLNTKSFEDYLNETEI